MIKKLIATASLVIFLFSSIGSSYVYAQDTNPWYIQTYRQWVTKVYDTNASPPEEIFGERYTAAQVQWVIFGLISFLLTSNDYTNGIICSMRSDVTTCLNENPLFTASAARQQENRGVFATIFNPERGFSGVSYVRGKITDLKLLPVPEARAQGFGFGALSPVQKVWKGSRDVMYGLFIVVIIAFAFMIMFRMKISPQVVVTVQSALPRILITLILITFSYAIAGFMVDLIYVVIGIFSFIILQFGFLGGAQWADVFRLMTTGPGDVPIGLLGWFWGFIGPVYYAIMNAAGSIWSLNWVGGTIAWILGWFIVAGILVWLFLACFRIFIMLIRTYLSILISVTFAPLIIGFGALTPGGGFWPWLRGIIANLLVYPVVGILFILSIFFLAATYTGVRDSLSTMISAGGTSTISVSSPFETTQYFWYPPITFGTQAADRNWDPLPILWTFAAIGIFAMIPKAGDLVKSLMSGKGVEGAGDLGKDVNAMFAGGLGYALGTGKYAYGKGVGAYFGGRERATQEQLTRLERMSKTPGITPTHYRIGGRLQEEREERLYGLQRWKRKLGGK